MSTTTLEAQGVRIVDARTLAGTVAQEMPPLAARWREEGAAVVCIAGVAQADGRSLDWLDTPHARGWLAAGGAGAARNGAAFAAALEEALRQGFVAADAAVLARMLPGDPLPLLSWDARPPPASPAAAPPRAPLGLYAIVDGAERLRQVLGAGARTVQVRIKTPDVADTAWTARLREELARSVALAAAAGAELFVNDHWQLAAELGAPGIHLGQEDLLALGTAGRAALRATGLALGVSSHSLWELCRARALAPRYIACGPVWPTTTKDMPWRPQGLDNLAWWCRMAQAPVVAIGGVLEPQQVRAAAQAGADGVCVVRGLGPEPRQTLPVLQSAFEEGRHARAPAGTAPAWPHPSLPTPLSAASG